MIGMVRVTSLPLVLTKADNRGGADDARRGENIDDFQAARFGRAGGVRANSEEGAVAIAPKSTCYRRSKSCLQTSDAR